MADMLVKLYALPELTPILQEMQNAGITIRSALAPELHIVRDWVHQNFSLYWESETTKAFSNTPLTCYIAIEQGKLIGFACVDATARGFFGPTGVSELARGKNVGKALLIYGMHQLKNLGYAYAIIGGVGPKEFYAKHVGAVEIPDSTPGIYDGLLRRKLNFYIPTQQDDAY